MIINGYDLTKLDQPFGELPQEVQWALRGAATDDGEIQVRYVPAKEWTTLNIRPSFDAPLLPYRLKPEPVTKTVSFDHWGVCYSGQAPTFADFNVNGNCALGKSAVTTVDGKMTKYVWEATP